VIAIAVVLALLISSYYLPRRLYPGEVRSYQGQDLSSISDVDENNIIGNQNVDVSTYRLTVTGLVNKTVQYTYSEVVSNHQRYEKVVTLYCVEGWRATILWEGIRVKDLLQEAGVDPKAVVVIFRAADGYSTSLPLDYILDKDILLAYKMNGVVMPPEKGFPFELVAESQYGYKWIKWVTQIELSDDVNYQGYWESRGYPNNATLR